MKHRVRILVPVLVFIVLFPARASDTVEWIRCINSNYSHRESLHGWEHTADVIEAALKQWQIRFSRTAAQDQGDEGVSWLRSRFQQDAGASVRLIYLASHQDRQGFLEHPDGKRMKWTEGWVADASFSVLLLDVCYAGVVPGEHWRGAAPFDLIVTPATAREKTYELRMFSRRPIDYRRRYPEVVDWLVGVLPEDWDGRISFLGFLFAHQFLQTSTAPSTPESWRSFFDGMEKKAEQFAAGRGAPFSSTLQVWPRPVWPR